MTGAGRAFSAGGNVPGFIRNVEDVEYRRAGMRTARLLVDMLKVKEHLFTGERIPAETAVQIGMANRVVPAGSLMDEALLLAHKFSAQPAQALQETKRALNLHLQAAALRVLPYALSAETESFSSPEVAATADSTAWSGRTTGTASISGPAWPTVAP